MTRDFRKSNRNSERSPEISMSHRESREEFRTGSRQGLLQRRVRQQEARDSSCNHFRLRSRQRPFTLVMTSWRKPTGQIQPHIKRPRIAPTTSIIPRGSHGKRPFSRKSVMASIVLVTWACDFTLDTIGSTTHERVPLNAGTRLMIPMPLKRTKKPS